MYILDASSTDFHHVILGIVYQFSSYQSVWFIWWVWKDSNQRPRDYEFLIINKLQHVTPTRASLAFVFWTAGDRNSRKELSKFAEFQDRTLSYMNRSSVQNRLLVKQKVSIFAYDERLIMRLIVSLTPTLSRTSAATSLILTDSLWRCTGNWLLKVLGTRIGLAACFRQICEQTFVGTVTYAEIKHRRAIGFIKFFEHKNVAVNAGGKFSHFGVKPCGLDSKNSASTLGTHNETDRSCLVPENNERKTPSWAKSE